MRNLPVSCCALAVATALCGCQGRGTASTAMNALPPRVTILSPTANRRLKAGDRFAVEGRVLVPEGAWFADRVVVKELDSKNTALSIESFAAPTQPISPGEYSFEAKLRAPNAPGKYVVRAIGLRHYGPGESPKSAISLDTQRSLSGDVEIEVIPR